MTMNDFTCKMIQIISYYAYLQGSPLRCITLPVGIYYIASQLASWHLDLICQLSVLVCVILGHHTQTVQQLLTLYSIPQSC